MQSAGLEILNRFSTSLDAKISEILTFISVTHPKERFDFQFALGKAACLLG